MNTPQVFEDQLRAWGLAPKPAVGRKFLAYAGLLANYGEANVIGARSYEDVLLDHVLDSLSCLLFGPLRGIETLVDVGTGGGLPGIPLGIFQRHLEVTLVEATQKKVQFLHVAKERLSLSRLEIVNARVEEVARDDRHRAAYGCATARAVSSLPVLLEYCVPLLSRGGYFIAMKGRPDSGELVAGEAAARQVGARRLQRIDVPLLPEIGDRRRSLIVYEKVADTPSKYPRRTGMPSKRPLGTE